MTSSLGGRAPSKDAAQGAPRPRPAFDLDAVRAEFPCLHQTIHKHPLVYLDNGATTQKPKVVIDAVSGFYARDNANIHRGVHELSQRATNRFEAVRETVRRYINGFETCEVIFTRGTTESVNLVAQAWGRAEVKAGDEIVISGMEHHSNIVPWQMLCEATGAKLRVVPITDDGELAMDELGRIISAKTKMVAIVHVSNALGTVNPVKEITDLAHRFGAKVLIDGAQAVAHAKVDVRDIGCDFYAFSGHKIFGPTGVGVLWGKKDILDRMPPWQGGGDMIASVSFEKTTYAALPNKLEAGTPHIDGVVGLSAAIEFVEKIGLDKIGAWEDILVKTATDELTKIPGVRIIGTAQKKASVVSFTIEGVHPHDIGTIMDRMGVAVRAGHHCAEPVMRRFKVPATARASFAFYNTLDEVDALVAAVQKVKEIFGV
jgi:cysteine desulfurase/selenocysteine lyase